MTPLETSLVEARARVLALRAWLAAARGQPVRLIETHISWVLLTETLAYKLKKPLTLPFIDTATLAARQACCAEELRLNRRLAPSIYLGIDEVRDTPAGPRFGGEGPLVEVAVRMRRFPDGALWSEQLAAGRLDVAQVDAMARRLAAFHAEAAVAPADSDFATAAAHARITRGQIAAMDAWQAAAPAAGGDFAWPPLRRWLSTTLAALAPWWESRRQAGRVREGHGDLHLANLLLLGGEPTAFDAIDFDPALRWIDVLDDAAFTVMDLLANGAPALAWRFLDATLEAGGDHAGLPALRFHLVSRALVRAQVMDLSAASRPAATLDAARYRALAAALADGANPRLAITHGLPGSGKSHVAQQLLERVGAVRLRSDVERKRLFGLAAGESSRGRVPAMYGPAATQRTYEHLLALAQTALEAGWPVIVDAAFLRRSERAAFSALAARLGVPFSILDCRAPMALLHERIRQRQAQGGDASEADGGVLDRLAAVAEALSSAEAAAAIEVDARDPAPAELVAQRWLAA